MQKCGPEDLFLLHIRMSHLMVLLPSSLVIASTGHLGHSSIASHLPHLTPPLITYLQVTWAIDRLSDGRIQLSPEMATAIPSGDSSSGVEAGSAVGSQQQRQQLAPKAERRGVAGPLSRSGQGRRTRAAV